MTDNEVARRDEVLAALTRILRREATESAIVTTRERVPTLCADGKVRYTERTDTRVVEIPPRISDVNRAADLLGRRCGLWDEPQEADGPDVCIVDDVGAKGGGTSSAGGAASAGGGGASSAKGGGGSSAKGGGGASAKGGGASSAKGGGASSAGGGGTSSAGGAASAGGASSAKGGASAKGASSAGGAGKGGAA